jgi:outer membrane autotransporter protein
LRRQADPAEADLRTRSRAQLTQTWMDLRPDRPLPVRDWGITPYARLAWLRLHRPGLQESGSLAAVSLLPQTDQRWVSHLGVRLQRQWSTVHGPAVLAADVGVQSHWGDQSLSSLQFYNADPGRRFDAASPPLTRHSLRLDIGIHAPVARHARLKLAYTGQYGAQQRQHGVWLGVSIAI